MSEVVVGNNNATEDGSEVAVTPEENEGVKGTSINGGSRASPNHNQHKHRRSSSSSNGSACEQQHRNSNGNIEDSNDGVENGVNETRQQQTQQKQHDSSNTNDDEYSEEDGNDDDRGDDEEDSDSRKDSMADMSPDECCKLLEAEIEQVHNGTHPDLLNTWQGIEEEQEAQLKEIDKWREKRLQSIENSRDAMQEINQQTHQDLIASTSNLLIRQLQLEQTQLVLEHLLNHSQEVPHTETTYHSSSHDDTSHTHSNTKHRQANGKPSPYNHVIVYQLTQREIMEDLRRLQGNLG